MASTIYEESKKRFRVDIYKKDLKNWGLEKEDKTLVKKWIDIGRDNEILLDKIEEIEIKLDQFIKLMTVYAHQSFVSDTKNYNEADTELLKYGGDKLNPDASEFHNNVVDRYMTSQKIREIFAPDIEIPTHLSQLDEYKKGL